MAERWAASACVVPKDRLHVLQIWTFFTGSLFPSMVVAGAGALVVDFLAIARMTG